MYYEHFGLNEAPFKITPDTRLFYEGGSRGDILEALVYAIASGEGMVKVVGEVGSGKTMLSRMLEVRLPDNVEIVYLANPSIAPGDILFAIAVEMKVEIPPGTDRIHALHTLQEALLARHAEGRQVVCFVEEAQSMPLATLEEVRLLSNLETHRAKLLQIVLFGQPELDENLNEPSIRQLRERIVHSFYLDPLGALDVGSYVSFRMRAVGYRGPDVFSRGAIKRLSKASQGLIRRVNILGDKALLAAFAENAHQVTDKHVRTAVKDSEFGRLRRRSSMALVAAGIGALACAVALGVAATLWLSGRFAPVAEQTQVGSPALTPTPGSDAGGATFGSAVQPVATQDTAAALGATPATSVAAGAGAPDTGAAQGPAAPAATLPAVAQPAVAAAAPDVGAAIPIGLPAATPPVATEAQRATAAGATSEGTVAPGLAQVREAVTAAGSVPPPGPAPPDAGVRATAPPAASAGPAPAVSAAVATPRPPVAAAAVSSTPATAPLPASGGALSGAVSAEVATTPRPVASGNDPAVATASASTAAPAGATPGPAPPVRAATADGAVLLEARLSETRRWLRSANGEHFSIQLLVTSQGRRAALEEFLARWDAAGDIRQLYVYATSIQGVAAYGVLFNEFRSIEAAQAALAELPASLKQHGPFIRNIRDINALG